MALGVTLVVIGGNLDLSVGSMLSFSTIVVWTCTTRSARELAIP
jgi:ribose transport system permease protein